MTRSSLCAAATVVLIAVASPSALAQPDAPLINASTATTATTTLSPEQARLRAEAARLERVQAEQEAAVEAGEGDVTSLWPTFIRTVVVLGAVCLLAYLLLGKLMPKLLQIEPPTAHRRLLKVVDRLALDQKRSVLILQLGDEYFLVGAAEQNISLMSKLDAERIDQLLAEAQRPGPGFARWGDMLGRRVSPSSQSSSHNQTKGS